MGRLQLLLEQFDAAKFEKEEDAAEVSALKKHKANYKKKSVNEEDDMEQEAKAAVSESEGASDFTQEREAAAEAAEQARQDATSDVERSKGIAVAAGFKMSTAKKANKEGAHKAIQNEEQGLTRAYDYDRKTRVVAFEKS